MAERDFADQPTAGKGSLASCLPGAKPLCLPLLPYERQLIELLGWSEEEYRWFSEEVRKRGTVRPAAYELIPDVQNGPVVPILISLAVGLVMTAVSALLAPKPKEPAQQRQRKLSDLTGPSRFNTTYGFDANVGLAAWGDAIAIPFGRYTDTSGGLLLTPKVVWSRLFSYGGYQMVKALYVCGEWGISKPNLAGIHLGNTPLDAAYEHLFAIYYRHGQGVNRIQGTDLLHGSRGTPDSGDPETYDDVFSCPSADAENDDAFCYTYTPNGSTQFGIYSPIANGTGLRTMWRVVSFPDSTKGDSKKRIKAEREKICGHDSRSSGMPGVGREYVRGIGIYEVNGQTVGSRTDVQVSVGSTAKLLIAAGKLPNFYDDEDTGVNVDDLNSSLENERSDADAQLQLGDTVQIGRTSWRVIERSRNIWKRNNKQIITLRCIDAFGTPFITVIPRKLIDDWDRTNRGKDFDEDNHVGLSSTPIALQALGIVKNVRESDVIEVGIKSQVWNQAQGMMNWNEVPEPDQLVKWDEDDVQVSGGGQMNTYMLRTSAFTVKVRPAGESPDGEEYKWSGLGEQFCIRSRRPVDVYNFLRVYFPQRGKYEFRFEPLPGSVIVKNFAPDEIFWELNANSSTRLRKTYATAYGNFTVYTVGQEVAQSELLDNQETGYVDKDADYVTVGNGPNNVSVDHYETSPYFDPHGKAHGWRNEVLGFAQLHQGQTKSVQINAEAVEQAGGTCKLKITATSIYIPRTICTPPGASPQYYSDWVWGPPMVEVVGADISDLWVVGGQLTHSIKITRDSNNNNKWLWHAYQNGARTVTAVFTINTIGEIVNVIPAGTNSRNFIPSSQCADVTYYPGAWSTSNSSNPEHEISYVNEIRVNEPVAPNYYNMTMMGLSLKADKNFSTLAQLRCWVPGGIQVYRHLTKDIGRSNLFSDFVYWLLTDAEAGAGDKISAELVDSESFERTALFLERNRIYFDYVLEDPTNIRQWITDTAKLLMCNFVIIDGKFGIEPALPTNAAGELSRDPVTISGIFSEGNIIEGSFALDYLEYEQRADFKAVTTYRYGEEFALPQETTVTVRYDGSDTGKNPIEQFALAPFCTQREQAILTSKYLLALRRHVKHTIQFKTSPVGLGLKPGDYIRVVTQANPYVPFSNGVIRAETGAVVTPTALKDGSYEVMMYQPGMEAVTDGQINIVDGRVADPALWGTVFSVRPSTASANVYQVQQITLDEEGLVEIVALDFPCDSELRSHIVRDLFDDSAWLVTE